MFLVLLELQAPNYLYRIIIGGVKDVCVEHLAGSQDLHVGQLELPPIILIGDGRIDGRQNGLFAGCHGCDRGMVNGMEG